MTGAAMDTPPADIAVDTPLVTKLIRTQHRDLDGPLTLVCDGVSHELEEGDAVTFDADLPHHFENPGKKDARFLSVIAAGLRRS